MHCMTIPDQLMTRVPSMAPSRAAAPTRVVALTRAVAPTRVVAPTGGVAPTRAAAPTRGHPWAGMATSPSVPATSGRDTHLATAEASDPGVAPWRELPLEP